MATDKETEAEVLKICRSPRKTPQHFREIWCMRELSEMNPRRKDGKCVVVDNARWNSVVIAQGETWGEVLKKLQKLGE